jgi:hypothetical protein
MPINKSWGDIRPTPKQFVVDESIEDYKFKAKLINVFDEQICKDNRGG